MLVWPDTALILIDLIETTIGSELGTVSGEAAVYLWQGEESFTPGALPGVQIEMLPGAMEDEREDSAMVTVWAADLGTARRLSETLAVHLAGTPAATAHGKVDTITVMTSPAPLPSDDESVVKVAQLWRCTTRPMWAPPTP